MGNNVYDGIITLITFIGCALALVVVFVATVMWGRKSGGSE